MKLTRGDEMDSKIILEGADGCGKTTVGQIVSEILKYDFIEIPNNDVVTGPYIREWLSNQWDAAYNTEVPSIRAKSELLNAFVFQSLQIVNRLECLPLMQEDRPVVFSRLWHSGYVYGILDGLDPGFMMHVHEIFRVPALNILLDVSPEVSRQRIFSRGGEAVEVYESREGFAEKVIDKYQELWALGEKSLGGAWVIVDATKPLECVCATVMHEICKYSFGTTGTIKTDGSFFGAVERS